MRRIKLVLGALGVVVAITAVSAVPAMANTNDNGFRNDNGRFFDNNPNNGFVLFNSGFNSPFFGGFPGFGAFNNVNGFDGFHNGFDGDHNFVVQRVG